MSGRMEASLLMRILDRLGLSRWAWSARRLYCPVKRGELVLEVGSGGNPYYRSNVLLDAYEETRERHWVPLVHNRPTILGFVEHLPFRDKAFDFVIASHVLEHSTDPARFLSELQRVAKAGYIEVPDAFMERVNPYRDHRLEITVRKERLLIRKKGNWCVDPELVELYEDRVKKILTQKTMRKYPFNFHVRYYWNEKIIFEVINPETDASWIAPESNATKERICSIRTKLYQAVLKTASFIFLQHQRNANFKLVNILACPACHNENLSISLDQIYCDGCGETYPVRNGIPVMYPPGARGAAA